VVAVEHEALTIPVLWRGQAWHDRHERIGNHMACGSHAQRNVRFRAVERIGSQQYPGIEEVTTITVGYSSGLKIRRLPEKGRAGSIPASGTSKSFKP